MPTSSQSQILSVVDYQLLQQQQQQQQQQQTISQDATAKAPVRISLSQTIVSEPKRRLHRDDSSMAVQDNNDNRSPSPLNDTSKRRDSVKMIDAGASSARAPQRTDILHMPVININMASQERSTSDYQQSARGIRTLGTSGRAQVPLTDNSSQSFQYVRTSFESNHDGDDDDDEKNEQYKSKYPRKPVAPTPASGIEDNSSFSDDDGGLKQIIRERRPSLLNENARRLLILGTIRPSRTFYKDMSEADVEHLMEYFRRMRNTHRQMTSEEINQDLATKFVEYKPKIFFDSASVTKAQVTNIEKIMEQYADTIRSQKAELVKLDNPMRFVIQQVGNEKPLTTIPREFNDCLLTLVTRTDPLRRSELVTELVREKLLEDVKANSLDISYFPGGVNYDVPRDEVDESGQIKLETYQKLKKRLNSRKVWHFNTPPVKKPNAIMAILPSDSPINIDHQRLLDALYERLKVNNENNDVRKCIVSMEFVPLSCILASSDISNHFVVECDSLETKNQLMEKPLKIVGNTKPQQTATLVMQSYDEEMKKEYEKFIKSEKYRELLKNHDEAVKRSSPSK